MLVKPRRYWHPLRAATSENWHVITYWYSSTWNEFVLYVYNANAFCRRTFLAKFAFPASLLGICKLSCQTQMARAIGRWDMEVHDG